jgi:hypothetical protein
MRRAARTYGLFLKRTEYGETSGVGYLVGVFAIERNGRGRRWFITHRPTGACFAYSEWPTLASARDFCERMLRRGEWQFTETTMEGALQARARYDFFHACHLVADEMGVPRRFVRRVA